MLKCIIVEDEFPAREELKYFILKHENFQLENEFENPIDALKFLEKNKVDCIFLDINMPELDGMNLARILQKLDPELKIIFITAYREYAVDAFEIRAFDYLLKPYSEARITQLLDNLTKSQNKFPIPKEVSKINKVTVLHHDKMIVLPVDKICYIEVVDKESTIYTENNKYVSKFKLSKWQEILPADKFYRTHRSYIVNLDKIIEIEPWFNGTYLLKLENISFKVPVSRANAKEFKEMLMTF